MKNIPIESDMWQVTSDVGDDVRSLWRSSRLSLVTSAPTKRRLRHASTFNLHPVELQPLFHRARPSTLNQFHAFTIVELLTVIAVIAILAAMLLPVLARARVGAQKKIAAVEISQIVGAIQQYDSVYGRFPVTANDQQWAGTNDFTCGGTNYAADGVTPLWVMGVTNNAEVIAILMDITNTTVTGANANFQKNPQQTIFLNAKQVSDPTLPGVGPDLVYRDPWGSPYIITMDTTYDEQCHDAYYCQRTVSQNPYPSSSQAGYNGLFNPDANGQSDNYLYHGKVMVWSAGPDRMVDTNSAANAGLNKDNVLSWQ